MDEKTLFAELWARETGTTRNVLARIPEGSDYRPDPKSRTAQEIAWVICSEERMIVEALETGTMQPAATAMPTSMREILELYEAQSATLPRRLADLPEERWSGTLDFGGRQRPAARLAWSFLFDIVHHRGQITTYLRPMGSTVPQIYGPSADEP